MHHCSHQTISSLVSKWLAKYYYVVSNTSIITVVFAATDALCQMPAHIQFSSKVMGHTWLSTILTFVYQDLSKNPK